MLEDDADAAANRLSDRLSGLEGEVIVLDTVNKEQSGKGEKASASTARALSQKANTCGGGALKAYDLCLQENFRELEKG